MRFTAEGMDTTHQNVYSDVQNIPGILSIGNQHFDYSMHVSSKHFQKKNWGFFDGLLIFRGSSSWAWKVWYTKFLEVKRTAPRFQLYPISYLQNKSGLLSIQQRETNVYNQEFMYKNTTYTVNIGQPKHKKGHSHNVTGTFILLWKNKEYCFIEFIQLGIFNLIHSTMDFKCD